MRPPFSSSAPVSSTAEAPFGDGRGPVGRIEPGETAGELSLLRPDHPHTATITASTTTEAAVIERDALAALLRRRPDIGVELYRNLAAQLGDRLLRTDEALISGAESAGKASRARRVG